MNVKFGISEFRNSYVKEREHIIGLRETTCKYV